jgi:hypothetical protein
LFLVILSLFLALSGCVCVLGGVLVAMICWAIYLNCDKKYPWTQNSFGTFFLGFLSSILPWFDITERLKGKTELYEILYWLVYYDSLLLYINPWDNAENYKMKKGASI